MSEEKKPSIIYFYLVILYFTLCIVNWLPLIDNVSLRVIKYGMFAIIFLYEMRNFGMKYPSSFLSPKGLTLILFSMIPGLFLSFNISDIVDIVIPFLVIWIFNYKRQFYYLALYRSINLVMLISVFHVISYFTGLLNIEANGPWNATFGQSAFGGYRTGYSNSLFLYIPFLIYMHSARGKKIISKESLVIFTLILAQFASGGRAGLLTSLVVLFIWFKIPTILKVIMSFYVIFLFQLDLVQEQMRIVDLDVNEENYDAISSGRLFLNTYYFDKFLQNPMFGYGFGEKLEMITKIEAHVVWLRNVINGGVIYTALVFYIFLNIYKKIIGNLYLSSDERKLFNSLFFSTLIITFLEPNYLIGSVQGEMVYWLIVSLLLKNPISINKNVIQKKI